MYRDYQQEAIDKTVDCINEGIRKPLIVAPTGSGKSHIIVGLCERIEGPILCVTHSQKLVEQNTQKMDDAGLAAGIWCSGLDRKDEGQRVIVATIQSVYKNFKLIYGASAVIVDEAHRLSTDSVQYGKLLRSMNSDAALIGLTATPFRLGSGCLVNGKDKLFDKVSYEIAIKLLIERGFLCSVTNRFPIDSLNAHIDSRKLKTFRGEYTAKSVDAELDEAKVEAQAKLISSVIAKGKRNKAIIFTQSIRHAERLQHFLKESIIIGVLAHSKMKKELCEDSIRGFESGKYNCLINVDMLTTGFDVEDIDLCVLARPTKSAGLYIQMVGRAMRPHPSKTEAWILDLAGVVDEHGPIDMPDVVGYHEANEPREKSEPAAVADDEDIGISTESPLQKEKKRAVEIGLTIHQEVDILAAKPWDAMLPDGVSKGAAMRVARATLRSMKTKKGDTCLVLTVYGRDPLTGGKLSARQYFNFFGSKGFARAMARDTFKKLFRLDALPPFFSQEGSPVTPNGYLLEDDYEYARALEARTNELLKFKLLKIIKNKAGYIELEQYDNDGITSPAAVERLAQA